MEGAVTNTPTQFAVHTVYSNGQPCREKQSIRAELISLADGTLVVAEGIKQELEKGSYSVSYCPKVRGRHKLSLLVNQQPIAGSPFDVFVEHPPTQLGKRVYSSSHSNISEMAFNKGGQLLVAHSDSVVALNTIGKSVAGGSSSDTPLENVQGLAIDEDGSILVTSRASEQLMKFNKDWTLAKAVGQEGDQPGQFNTIGRVKISPTTHKYYVCDHGNHRIQVFDQDLKHAFSFGTEGRKLGELYCPTDVAFDDAGHVYVVDSKNNRVQKFSPRGDPLFKFLDLEPGRHQIYDKCSASILIRGKFFYLAQDKTVSVYTLSGEKVTSFGFNLKSPGRKLHRNYNPNAIAVDEDGFLHVARTKSGWMYSGRIYVY